MFTRPEVFPVHRKPPSSERRKKFASPKDLAGPTWYTREGSVGLNFALHAKHVKRFVGSYAKE